jgi:hypothetical protein
MKLLAKFLLVAATLPLAMAADEGWIAMPAIAKEWSDALPAIDTTCCALVLDTPSLTQIRASVLAAPLTRPGTPAAVVERSTKLLSQLPITGEAGLKIEWFTGGDPITDVKHSLHLQDCRVQTSYRVGSTTITRTVLPSAADGAIFIHFLADQPGALAFRVHLETPKEAPPRIEDRRQLIGASAAGLASHVWVLPFEAEVATEGQAIAIRGEGEALVIWSFAKDDEARKSLATTLTRLGERHDPGHSPPDPTRIWHGVLNARTKSIKNSP